MQVGGLHQYRKTNVGANIVRPFFAVILAISSAVNIGAARTVREDGPYGGGRIQILSAKTIPCTNEINKDMFVRTETPRFTESGCEYFILRPA